MTNEEKLDIVLEYKNIKNSTIAQKLDVSPALVSQWRNKRALKLKTLHLNALENAFNIPLDIFTNSDIDTKDKIIEKLKDCSRDTYNNCVVKRHIPIELIGNWHCYNFNHNGKLDSDRVEITRYEVKVYNSNNILTHTGYPIAVNNYQTLLVLTKLNKPYSIIVAINNDIIDNSIFYTSSSLKAHNGKDAVMFCLFSKEKIEKSVVIDILGDKSKNLLTINDNIIKNIEIFKADKEKLINKAVSLKYVVGKWNIYFSNVSSSNKITIDENLHVTWCKDGKFYKDGNLTRDKDAVILYFPNNNYHSSYFIFKIDNIDTKIIQYIGSKSITGENIISIGVMSKKELDTKEIEAILNSDNSRLNVSKVYENLYNYINK